jgi:hypothetical protein
MGVGMASPFFSAMTLASFHQRRAKLPRKRRKPMMSHGWGLLGRISEGWWGI